MRNSVLSVDAVEFVPKAYPGVSNKKFNYCWYFQQNNKKIFHFQPSSTVSGSKQSAQDRIELARKSQNVQQTMIQRHQNNWQQSGSSHHHHHHHNNYSDDGYKSGSSYHQQNYNQYGNIQDYAQFDGGSRDYTDKHLVILY